MILFSIYFHSGLAVQAEAGVSGGRLEKGKQDNT